MRIERVHPLLEAASTGNPGALDQLLRICQPDIRRYARRNCLASDVDDAVQETLLILSRHLGSLRAIAAFSSWLFSIVRRECRRLEKKIFGFDSFDEANFLETMAPETLRFEVVQAIESMPLHYREVIVLRDLEELTIGEMASRLGISVAAAKSRLHWARQLLREYLTEA